MIKFSVTIPAYKGCYLNEAIESVLSQSYQNYELIVVDDCSPEDLQSIVSQYKDDRIRFYRNEKNFGAINVVDNWNKCLEYATGDYVICMGDDDRLLPCCLEEFSRLIAKYPCLNVFHAWTQVIDENSNVTTVLEPRPEHESFYSMIYYRWKGRVQFIGDFCFKVDHLRQNGGYFKLPLAWGSDDITVSRAAFNYGIANTNNLCFEYRSSTLTISNSTKSTKEKLLASISENKWFKDLFSQVNISELTDTDRWFLLRLKQIVDQSSRKKMTSEIILDIKSNFWKIIPWTIKCSKFGIERSYFLKMCVRNCFIK